MNAPVTLKPQVRQVDFANARDVQRVEEFVREHRASIFHRPAWLNAVEAGTGKRAAGLISEQLGAITGWLPLTKVRSKLFGHSLVSSGFAVDGGICADSEPASQALADAVKEFAKQDGYSSVELRGGTIPDGWHRWDDKHCGFERDLACDDDAELLAIPRKARAEVRKGLKHDLEVRTGRDASDLDKHYAVYSESVRNLGTPVFPRALFSSMLAAFGDTADILTVLKDGMPIASVLSFYSNGKVMPFWGGGTRGARSLRANELMYYKLMLHARRKGMRSFDFGRSKTGSGPYSFKKNWGFQPAKLVYGQWTVPGKDPRNIDPTSDAYSRKIEIWKKLPLPVANAIGPMIARDLA